MKLKMKLVGAALAAMPDAGLVELNLEPFSVAIGDFLTHPLFPQRALVCVARHIDLVRREVEVYLDFAEQIEGMAPMH